MSFKITARTILHLGSDLISSDAVAIYELIKNAIDAKSKNGVDVCFDLVIRQSDFASAVMAIEEAPDISLEDAQNTLLAKVSLGANENLRERYINAILGAKSKRSLVAAANEAYRHCNRIVIYDTGQGMSFKDLSEIYLTIGTTNRAKKVREALDSGIQESPCLGEKGVGRLSAMRLGWLLHVETKSEDDTNVNTLEIDWKRFLEADDADATTVEIYPKKGAKSTADSFTKITISDLRSSWSISRLTEVASEQIARMTDPFSWSGRRFQIRLSINGVAVQPVRAVVRDLLIQAHAKCVGKFFIDEDGQPAMSATVESSLYNGDAKEFKFDVVDLMGMSGLRESGQPSSILRTLGPVRFEFYWFNRQRLKALAGVGDRVLVKSLVKTWSGICLFRDGYRVLPYGDEGDDWLDLDVTALASSGYKLNTKQLIGRVQIGRLTNPKLLDQTNRQGLVETPEKEVLIGLLRVLISRWWHDYLNEASRTKKRTELSEFEAAEEESVVASLEARATQSLKQIKTHYTGEAQLLRDVRDAFAEIKDAHQRAVQRIQTIEEEKERLTQLAGVGLLVEIVAHELTRATELTQATLKDLSRREIDTDAAAALNTLGQQIKVIQKRLQALEPLSITARSRRSRLKIFNIVQYVMDGHVAQFERHKVKYTLSNNSDTSAVGLVIEGHVVQVLENLISNSIYWLDLEKKEHPAFKPEVKITILANPTRIIYADNGPGIPKSRRESVFEPFFSTKSGSNSRRQGLGLYIARQCAEIMGGTLNLSDIGIPHENRFNTFQLELKEDVDDA